MYIVPELREEKILCCVQLIVAIDINIHTKVDYSWFEGNILHTVGTNGYSTP